MLVTMTPDESQIDPNDSLPTALLSGFIGVCIIAICCAIKFIVAIPRLFTDDWTWQEFAWLPLQIIVIGFLPGFITGLLLPLRRFGRVGYFVIGAVCANFYLLACFALFEPVELLNARWQAVVAFATIATAVGGPLGISVAADAMETDTTESKSG